MSWTKRTTCLPVLVIFVHLGEEFRPKIYQKEQPTQNQRKVLHTLTRQEISCEVENSSHGDGFFMLEDYLPLMLPATDRWGEVRPPAKVPKVARRNTPKTVF